MTNSSNIYSAIDPDSQISEEQIARDYDFLLQVLPRSIEMEIDDQDMTDRIFSFLRQAPGEIIVEIAAMERDGMTAEIIELFKREKSVKSVKLSKSIKPEPRQTVDPGEDDADAHVDTNDFTLVDDYVICHPGIYGDGRAFAVYTLLCHHARPPKSVCWPSVLKMSQRFGWSRESITEAIEKLIKLGLIKRGEKKEGSSYKYTLPYRHRSKKSQQKKRA